jgi:hypothetical protein
VVCVFFLTNQTRTSNTQSTDPFDSSATPQEKYQKLLGVLNQVKIHGPPPPFDPVRQGKLLGPFNKPGVQLPFSSLGIDLRLLGIKEGPTLAARKIIDNLNDLRAETAVYMGCLLGVSGCGKTRTLFDVAQDHFLVLIECVPLGEERFEYTRDKNFGSMVKDIDRLEKNKDFQEHAERRIMIEFLARFLFLRGLFKLKPDLTPLEFLLTQLNGGQESIASLVNELRLVSYDNLSILLQMTCMDLRSSLVGTHKLIVALDEANVAQTKLFPGLFKNSSYPPSKRGLLTALTNVLLLPGIEVSILYAGTALTLGTGAKSIQSDIGKANKLSVVTQFEPTSEEDVRSFFENILDLSGCESVLDSDMIRELQGRARLKTAVIDRLSEQAPEEFPDEPIKTKRLSSAIKGAIDLHYKRMFERLYEACSQPIIVDYLKKILVASIMDSNLTFSPTAYDIVDFVNVGLCQLKRVEGKYVWTLAEPLAIRVAFNVLRKLGISSSDLVLDKALTLFYDHLLQFGNKTSEKGKLFEILVAAQLLTWNGHTLSSLPISSKLTNLPSWISDFSFSMTKFGTAHQLGFKSDLDYVQHVSEKGQIDSILLPENAMKPDMLYMMKKGDKWFAFVLQQKCWTSKMDSSDIKEAHATTNLSLVYSQIRSSADNNGLSFLPNAKLFHEITNDAFQKGGSGDALGGVIRLVVLIAPNVNDTEVSSIIENDKEYDKEKELNLVVTKGSLEKFFTDGLTRDAIQLLFKE